MSVTNPWFYCLVMLLFIAEGAILPRFLPFHRDLNRSEIDSQRLSALDGLRGVLALSVFFTHATSYYYFEKLGLWDFPPSNFYSQMAVFPVTMFFFITGFLFWAKLAKSGRIPARRFFYHRMGRLGGAYGLACVLLFLLVAVVSGFHRNVPWRELVGEIVAYAAFSGAGHPLNDVRSSGLWLGQAWTLRFEWIFYLTLPALGWFARRRFGFTILLAPAAVMLFLILQLSLSGTSARVASLIASYLNFLVFGFGVGMLAATLKPAPHHVQWMRSGAAAMVTLVSIGATVFFVKPTYGWLESLGLAAGFVCVCFGNNWFGLLTSNPLIFLGRISYSFYLLHMLVLTSGLLLLRKFVPVASLDALSWWGYMSLCGVFAVLIAAFSYQYFEHPFLRPTHSSPTVSRDRGTAVDAAASHSQG